MNFRLIMLNQNIGTMQNCYMDIGSIIIHIKTKDFYKDIADDVKRSYNTSTYEVDRPLLKRMNKKFRGLMKD